MKSKSLIIIKGRRSVTADTALRLARYFGNSAEFWLGLQQDYDLRQAAEQADLVASGVMPFAMN